MDFIVGLPQSHGFSVLMVVVDRLTKYAHFGALPSNFTAIRVAHLFIEIVIRHHGFPTSIVSDRDPVFFSTFREKLFKLSGTKLKHSTAYHPQSDGQIEVVIEELNSTYELILKSDQVLGIDCYFGLNFAIIRLIIKVLRCLISKLFVEYCQ